MGITAKSKTKTYIDNCPGMSFLLVFFPPEEDRHPTTTTKPPTTFKRPNSHTNPLLTKAQSTISICILLLFLTLLLFTLSSFQPSSNSPPRAGELPLVALQGMGKLHLRGTRAMADLLVCHVSEETNEDHFRVFFRLLLRSGLLSRYDVVFLFPNSSLSIKLEALITREDDAFLRLLEYYYNNHLMDKKMNHTSLLGFDVARFLREKESGEPLWGRNLKVVNNDDINKNGSNIPGSNSTESSRPSHGSVVSFEAGELDPENSLSGFVDHVPMGTRRWACYPMLLGRVRRNFKHVVLVDVKGSLLMGDPLARLGARMSPESVYVFGRTTGKRNSDKTQSLGRVDSIFLMGGARGVRRLSSSMLTEIARVAMQQRKRRNSVTESGVLSQLVGNEHILKSVDIVEATESLPELSSLIGLSSNFNSSSRDFHYKWSVIRRGNGNIWELNSVIMKLICDCEVDSFVYTDC